MFTYFSLKNHLKSLPDNGKILVAVLNWGIGHATRCIPIIKQLQELGFQPVIASDGDALLLLQKAFPELPSYELPSYKVVYAKKKSLFKIKLLIQSPKFYKTYHKEHRFTQDLVESENINAVISDNRFGVYHKSVPSIYITHQLRVKSGVTTHFSTKIHRRIIANFDECWVPDVKETPNLSGTLSHAIKLNTPVKYIGVLSQFQRQELPKKYDILVLLSGPEPQRSLLEDSLFKELNKLAQKVCFVRGVLDNKSKKTQKGSCTIYNYLLGADLQKVLNESELVLARSGYSTLMDLAILQKKAFFIPTPGQPEQLYLAKYIEQQRIAPFAIQEEFSIDLLNRVSEYFGF